MNAWDNLRLGAGLLWGRIQGLGVAARPKMLGFETKRLSLRQFRPDDFQAVSQWEDSAIARHDTTSEAQAFLEFCFREYRTRGIGPWAILMKQTNTLVGNCGFPHIDFNQAIGDVNYFVSAAYRGQGLATEALFALCAFGFDNLKLTRIRGQCSPENMSSERVMRKVGRSLKRGDGLVRV